MRWAFVLQLGPDTHPPQSRFEGWIEEVDTGRELRFRSTEELLAFLGECFESAREHALEPREDDEDDL
jgi:hypothetical protein